MERKQISSCIVKNDIAKNYKAGDVVFVVTNELCKSKGLITIRSKLKYTPAIYVPVEYVKSTDRLGQHDKGDPKICVSLDSRRKAGKPHFVGDEYVKSYTRAAQFYLGSPGEWLFVLRRARRSPSAYSIVNYIKLKTYE